MNATNKKINVINIVSLVPILLFPIYLIVGVMGLSTPSTPQVQKTLFYIIGTYPLFILLMFYLSRKFESLKIAILGLLPFFAGLIFFVWLIVGQTLYSDLRDDSTINNGLNLDIENLNYISNIYTNSQISLVDDGTYLEYIHDRNGSSGTWNVNEDNLILRNKSLGDQILKLKNGVIVSDEYISVPNLLFFEHFTGINKEIFENKANRPIYKISNFAYSNKDQEYLILISKYDDREFSELFEEYNCSIIEKNCIKSGLLTEANNAFIDIRKSTTSSSSKADDVFDNTGVDINWRIWDKETGSLYGGVEYNDNDALLLYGFVYNTKKLTDAESVASNFDLKRFDKVFKRLKK